MCPAKRMSLEINAFTPLIIPTIGEEEELAPPIPITIGIGASAGGHEPLEHIFLAIPSDCDLSIVVVMHLPPDGPPLLADFIRRYTTMEVLTVEEGMRLRPNTVYVMPPGKELTVSDGRLQLHEFDELKGKPKHPINRFFTSLGADLGERAVAVVLSGFGSDGSEGVKKIKEGGGFVLVQDPKTATNPAMPQNAIATGAANIILPAEEIADRLAEIARGRCRLPQQVCLTTTLDEELHTLFAILKAKTSHDFSSYKKNTILRRIERRMAINEVGGLKKYIAILEENPHEAQTLCEDFLIGVTRFFRDPEAFAFLRSEVIPRLFFNQDPQYPIRIWHACCATGEEAYSVAILIREYLEKENLQIKVQIFATDIDEAAVAQARAGLYSDDIGSEVSEELLKKYFTRNENRWQVTKQLREMIVFAHHSLIKDPPFSQLDLLVCRNFLIYLNPDIQQRLIPLFHQVLRPGGFLFLGSAETLGLNSDLFTPLDKKWKIFTRQEGQRRVDTLFPYSSLVRKSAVTARSSPPAAALETTPVALAEKLLIERYAPARVIINEKNEVIHFSSLAGSYLLLPEGAPTRDLLKMAREELRPALRAAIYKAFTDQQEIVFQGIKMVVDCNNVSVNVIVVPLNAPPQTGKLASVIFEPSPNLPVLPATSSEENTGEKTSHDALVRQLEEQLRVTDEQLQATSEQLETSNEGFMSANEELMTVNEELQSTNEELQSTNEELETSKEELQVLNEELVTVNFELQSKVEDLNQITDDLENLLASSEIATLFLDRNLNIKGFTPAAAAVFNLIQTDIGRPFRHFAGKIDWPTFTQDTDTVLAGQPFTEQEVATLNEKRCYLRRIFPYTTKENQIDGIVVTLIDITDRQLAEEALRESEKRLRLFIEQAPAGLAMFDTEMRYLTASRRWRKDYGLNDRDLTGLSHYEVFPEISAEWREAHRRGLAGEVLRVEADRFERADGSVQWIRWEIRPWIEATGNIGGIVIFAEDITDIIKAEEVLRRYELLAGHSRDIILFVRRDDGRILEANVAAVKTYGYNHAELLELTVTDLRAPESLVLTAEQMAEADAKGILFETFHRCKDGSTFPAEVSSQGATIGGTRTLISIIRDITERKQAERQIQQHLEELRASNDDLESFNNAAVGRELRMIELKNEINELCVQCGQSPRYPLDLDEEQS